jgi:hypothetical protein
MLLKAELPSIATCTPAPAVGHAQHHGRKLTDTFHAAAETALPCPRLPVVTTMLAEGRPRSAACKLHRDINNIVALGTAIPVSAVLSPERRLRGPPSYLSL